MAVVPMGEAVAPAAVAEPMTIEKTSKALKAQCVWAGLFIVVGFCGVILSDLYRSPWLFALGVIGVLGGLTWYIIVRVRIWWNHA